VDRVLVIFVPLLVVLIPAFKMVPALYRLRMNLRIYRWYRALLKLEREVASDAGMPEREREAIMGRLDHMERAVNRLKVPAPFAGQFYELRGHIGFVRGQLASRHSG